jgi:hypothetical protein
MADANASEASIDHATVTVTSEPGALAKDFKKDGNDGEDDKVGTSQVDYGDTTDDASYHDDDAYDDDTVSAYEEDEGKAKKPRRRSSTSTTTPSKKKYDSGANDGAERKSSFAANTKDPQSFDAMYKALLVYKKQNGHLLVPTRYPKLGLGAWVSSQRVYYRRQREKGATLTATRMEQIERLNKIGFVWDANFARSFRCSAERIRATYNGTGTSIFAAADDSDSASAVPKPPPKKRARRSRKYVEEEEIIVPGDDDRKELLKSYLRDFDNALTDEQVLTLTIATAGWSESEIRSLMNQAAMAPVRDYYQAARLRREELQETKGTLARLLSSESGLNRNEEEPNLRNVEISDFHEALAKVKPSAGS